MARAIQYVGGEDSTNSIKVVGGKDIGTKRAVYTTLGDLIAGEDLTNDVLKTEHQYSYHYIAAPTADSVVKASAGFLHAIILGAWVTGGTVEVSDHASDGDGNVKIKLTAGATDESGFPKTVLVDSVFGTGITVDTIGLTDVTLLYR